MIAGTFVSWAVGAGGGGGTTSLSAGAVGGSIAQDDFNDTDGLNLTSHTPDKGSGWALVAGTGDPVITSAGRIHADVADFFVAYMVDTPPTADYEVQADIVFKSLVSNNYAGISARATTNDDDSYALIYHVDSAAFLLTSKVGGVGTTRDTYSYSPAADESVRLALRVTGSSIQGYINGVLRLSTTNSDVTAANHAGVRLRPLGGADTETTGMHLDNFNVIPVANTPRATAFPAGRTSGSVSVRAQGAPLTADAFTVGADTLLGTYDANWTRIDGATDLKIIATSDRIRSHPTGVSRAMVYGRDHSDTGPQYIKATVLTSTYGCDVMAYASNAGSGVNAYAINTVSNYGGSANACRLMRCDNGTWTPLVTVQSGITAGQAYVVELVVRQLASSTVVMGRIDGGAWVTYEDSSGSRKTTGKIGIGAYDDGGAGDLFDNITIHYGFAGLAVAFAAGVTATGGGGTSLTGGLATATATAFAATRTATKSVSPGERGSGLVFGDPTTSYPGFDTGAGITVARDAAVDNLQQFTIFSFYRDKLYGTSFANNQYVPWLAKMNAAITAGWNFVCWSAPTIHFYWKGSADLSYIFDNTNGSRYILPQNDDNVERVVVCVVDLTASAGNKVKIYEGPVGGTLEGGWAPSSASEGSGLSSDASYDFTIGYHPDYHYGANRPFLATGIHDGALSQAQIEAVLATMSRGDWLMFTHLGLDSGTTAKEDFGRTCTAITTYRTPRLMNDTPTYWLGPAYVTATGFAAGVTATGGGGTSLTAGRALATAVAFAASRTVGTSSRAGVLATATAVARAATRTLGTTARTAGLALATASGLAASRTVGQASRIAGLAVATAVARAAVRTASITRTMGLPVATAVAFAATRTLGTSSRAAGRAVATAVAFAATRTATRSAVGGLPTATATAFAATRTSSAISRAAGLALASATGFAAIRTLGTSSRPSTLATATAVARAATRVATRAAPAGLATATALARTATVSSVLGRTAGLATASAVAFAATRTSGAASRTAGLALATATALAATRTTAISRATGLATATAVARTASLSSVLGRTAGLALATALARPATRTPSRAATGGIGTATAVAFAVTRTTAINRATGLASATAVARAASSLSVLGRAAGRAVATATAFVVAATKSTARAAGRATVSAVAFAITRSSGAISRATGLAQVTATGLAAGRTILSSLAAGVSQGTATAFGVTRTLATARAAGRAQATAQALAITRTAGLATRDAGLAEATATASPVNLLALAALAAGLAEAVAEAFPVGQTLTLPSIPTIRRVKLKAPVLLTPRVSMAKMQSPRVTNIGLVYPPALVGQEW